MTFGFRNRWRVAYSTKPIAGERHRERDEHAPGTRRVSAPRPRDPADEHEQQRERDVEEDDVLERAVEVDRVRGLDGVEREERRRAPTRAARPGGARPRCSAASDPRHRVGQHPGGDDAVERHEQVRGRPADRDRHAERHRRDREHRQHGRPPADREREQDHRDDRGRPGRGGDASAGPSASGTGRVSAMWKTRIDRRDRERAEHRRARASATTGTTSAAAASSATSDQRDRSVHVRAISAVVGVGLVAA